jgi:hypothetical protein
MENMFMGIGRGISAIRSAACSAAMPWLTAAIAIVACVGRSAAANDSDRPAPAEPGQATVHDQVAPVVKLRAEPFRLEDVRLLPGPFQHAMELDHKYLLSLDPDRWLYVFRIAAGLPSEAKPYGGWEGPKERARGEFVGLYLSACAEMYASTGDQRVKQKTDRIVAGLAECQAKVGNGFLHAARPDTFTTRGEAPLGLWYQTHKLLAGLLDVHQYCGNQQALEVARKLADWAKRGTDRFGDAHIQKLLDIEHGGINEALANLYARTGDEKYLKLALRFNHMAVIGPAMKREDKLDGLHANTQIPKFVGTARQYELTGDESLKTASLFFWETVVKERSYVTGGNSDGEYFTPKRTLSQALGHWTCETCNTYNMLKLTRHLFFWDPKAEYADYYERALYNHILASQDPQTGMMVYPCPVGPGAVKKYCTPEDSFWCCTGTGVENHAKYGDSIYFHHGQAALFLNLFIASELNWQSCGLKLRQETRYPEEGSTRLLFTCEQPVKLSLSIRHPYWAVSGFEVRVNGRREADGGLPSSYAVLTRTWKSGDVVEVSMPFSLRTEGFRDNPRRLAFLHGPLVLCAETKSDRSKFKPPYPAAVAVEGQLLSLLRPVPERPSTFVAPSTVLHLPEEKEGELVTLEPFYKVCGPRKYVVYWDLFTPAEWMAKRHPGK